MYTAHIRIVATLFLDGKILENEVFDENRLSAYHAVRSDKKIEYVAR